MQSSSFQYFTFAAAFIRSSFLTSPGLKLRAGQVPFAGWWYNNLVCHMLATRAATT
jgi:hypothetical protein